MLSPPSPDCHPTLLGPPRVHLSCPTPPPLHGSPLRCALFALSFDWGLLCSRFLQGSASANGSPLLPTSGASTPGRGGRRQLPQTPLTLRPSVAYKTANSSPVHFAGAQTSLPAFSPGRLSRGLSEHNALLQRDPLSQPLAASSRIGSDPYKSLLLKLWPTGRLHQKHLRLC